MVLCGNFLKRLEFKYDDYDQIWNPRIRKSRLVNLSRDFRHSFFHITV